MALSRKWLSLFGLLASVRALVLPRPHGSRVHTRSHASSSPASSFRLGASSPTVSNDEELLPGIAVIDASNSELKGQLDKLCDRPFFRLYSIDILASCEYMPQELFECYTESCEIYPEDENEVSEHLCCDA